MIQDIGPHQFHNRFYPHQAGPGDYFLFYEKRAVLLRHGDGQIEFPLFEEVSEVARQRAVYLFSIDEKRFFWSDTEGAHTYDSYPAGYDFEGIQVMRRARPKHLAFAAVTGLQLVGWYRSRRFCGGCGASLAHSEKERMLYCSNCGQTEYPKLSPAVIIAVTHGNRLLMSKYAGREYKKYALLAGFAEIGETIEDTVRREVMEEVGLKVKNLHYYKSQPWSFTDTLLMGFFAELDGDDAIRLDREELAMAEWFERDAIPVKYEDCSLTNEMMMAFKEGRI